MNVQNVKGICLEAGGVRVIAYLPVLRMLKTKAWPTKFAGTSGGAVVSFLLAIGYTPDEIWSLMNNGLMKRMSPRSNYLMASYRKGLRKSEAIISVLEDVCMAKTGMLNPTFGDIKERFNTDLYVYAVNETLGVGEIFCAEEDESESAILAVAASAAIPIYYTPVKIGPFLYSDGGALNPYPIKYLSDPSYGNLQPDEILGLMIERSSELTGEPFVADSLSSRFGRILDIMVQGNSKVHMSDELYARTIKISDMGVSSTDFNMSVKNSMKLEMAGYAKSKELR